MFLCDQFRPVTDTVGVFNAAVSRCASEYIHWMQGNLSHGSSLQTVPLPSGQLADRLRAMSPLVRVGQTRIAFVPVTGEWTACFTNGWRGTDVSSIVPILSKRLGCTAIRVTSVPDIREGPNRRYGARIVEVHRGDQKPARVISVANDGGKWVEFASGTPLPGERPTWFQARIHRDRFTQENLRELVVSLVPGIWDVAAWPSDGAVIVERVGVLPANFTPVDLSEVQQTIPRAT